MQDINEEYGNTLRGGTVTYGTERARVIAKDREVT